MSATTYNTYCCIKVKFQILHLTSIFKNNLIVIRHKRLLVLLN